MELHNSLYPLKEDNDIRVVHDWLEFALTTTKCIFSDEKIRH